MAKSISQLVDQPDLEVEMIPLEEIHFDPENPNVLPDEMYDALLQDIRDNGFTQPVVVWRNPEGETRMVDGEHRTRALRELGAARVPAVIIEAENQDEARMRLLTHNRLRGQFVPIRLAYMLKDLAERIPEKELRRRLGMEESELRDNLRLAKFTDDLGEKLRETTEREAKDAPVALSFLLTERDARVVERAIAKANEKGDRGKALVAICRAWEKAA